MAELWWSGLSGVRRQEPLGRHSWIQIGGPAEFFLELQDTSALPALIRRLRAGQIGYRVVGAGTNVLFPDEGLPGLTVKLASRGYRIDDETVTAQAGTPMPKLALETAKHGLSGLEFGAGVPGTVGGSIFGNAGAFGTEVRDRLLRVEAVDPDGQILELSNAECAFAYRESAFKSGGERGWVILSARFSVRTADPASIREQIRRVQGERRRTQPIDRRSLGSTFKNPPGQAAGQLIEACGLKGRRVGGAQVSPKHANFILNLGGATAADVLALMAEMRGRVQQRFGIELEPEIQVFEADAGR